MHANNRHDNHYPLHRQALNDNEAPQSREALDADRSERTSTLDANRPGKFNAKHARLLAWEQESDRELRDELRRVGLSR